MSKIFVAVLATSLLLTGSLFSCKESSPGESSDQYEEEYDGPMERALLEIEKTKDPALGYVPFERLFDAISATQALRSAPGAGSLGILWNERGPIFDSLGANNGNTRAGAVGVTSPGTYTSGRMRALLVDASDATGNTVFVGGVGGGLWKTTNFLSTIPVWVNINDFFDNLSISTICQDPSNPDVMYFGTGEPTSNADAILGKGIWKSVDHGATWAILPATVTYTRTFKLICDASGNLYAAIRGGGLRRSTNGGVNFTDISPTGYSAVSCTDMEFSSGGVLHASFGYYTSTNTAVIRYTASPSTVDGTGWSAPTGLPSPANRLEIAATGNTVYLMATQGASSAANNIYAVLKSTDGGLSYSQQNAAAYSAFTSGQAWYDVSFDVNPNNDSEIYLGQLDLYRSVNSGATVTRMSYWVTSAPYIHADQHFLKVINSGLETRLIAGNDGGIFYSADNGITFTDKNRNLGLKQFYSCAIHPTLTNYFLAGAQDNGTHRLTQPGLSYSHEVTGGDGAYVDIDQDQPQYQFAAYVYNQYKRSINGGNTWSNFYFTTAAVGLFINPFDYDDVNNKFYASYGTQLLRWNNPITATSVATSDTSRFVIPGASGNVTALYASPNTNDRLFVGTSTGKLFRIENAGTMTSANIAGNTTDITGPSFSGFLNCVITGDNDQNIMAIFTNYGVNNVWYSIDGGANWTAIDGNLPDMPVRWGVFAPGYSNKLVIATEAGVYVATSVNGSSTVWLPSPEFPIVKTNMLKVRQSDQLILAATHGRGLWSSFVPNVIPVKNVVLQATASNGNSNLNWTQVGATSATKFTIQYSINGVSFSNIATVNYLTSRFIHQLSSPVGYYRIVAEEPNGGLVYSNTVVIRSSKITSGINLRITPNPIVSAGNFILSSSVAEEVKWNVLDAQGKLIQSSKTIIPAGGSLRLPVNTSNLAKGVYYIRLTSQDGSSKTTAFIKQ